MDQEEFSLNVSYTKNNFSKFKNGELNLFCLNSQSIRNKFEMFINFIDSQEFLLHVIVLTEVWIYSNENDRYQISDYNMYVCNRDSNRSGGVIIYVHNSLNSNQITSISFNNNEFLLVELLDYKIKIFGVYKQPASDINEFIEYWENFLKKYKNFVALGDININLLDNFDNNVLNYKNMLLSNGCAIVNKIDLVYATRKSNTIQTIIDHVVTDLLTPEYTFLVSDTDLSDHRFLLVNVDLQRPVKDKYFTKTILNYENIETGNLLSRNNLSSLNDLNELSDFLTNLIDSNTKQVKIRIDNKKDSRKPWINRKIILNMEIRNKLFKLHKKYPESLIFKENFLNYKMQVVKEIRYSKRNYFKKEISESKNSNKKLWQFMNEFGVGKSKKNKTFSHIKVNDEEIFDEKLICDSFNSYFVNVSSQSQIAASNTILDQTNEVTITEPFSLEETNEIEITNIVNNLNLNSATGPDRISTRFIKKFLPNLIFIFVLLINKMFKDGSFADCLKHAIVTPLFKHGCKLTISNYRPISVLNCISKIIEKILYFRLIKFLKNNRIISDHQYGFTQNSNTLSSAMHLMDNIRQGLDKKKCVSALFIDLSKAFDMVNHELLLLRLRQIGITDTISLSLFKNYLSSRTQNVKYGNSVGSPLNISCGVPQGSILGPVFFTIFINGIFNLKLIGTIQLYADDMALVYNCDNLIALYEAMNSDLKDINDWLINSKLLINIEKTNYIIFKTRNKFSNVNFADYTLSLNNKIIRSVSDVEFLGLKLDEELNWKHQINKITSKINSSTFALKRLSYILPERAKWHFFNSSIMSHVSYLNPIWNTCSVTQQKMLKICINRAIRVIKKLPYRCSSQILYSEKILPLDKFNDYSTMLLIFKIKNNLIKSNFEIKLNSNCTRSNNNFVINYCRTTIGQKNLLFHGLSLYNNLPLDIKNEIRISSFKTKLRKHLYTT